MRNFLYILLGMMILALGAVVYYWIFSQGLPHANQASNNFPATTAVWAALAGSLLTGAITIYSATRTAQLNTGLEYLKRKLDAERKSYDELYHAALYYYRTLAKLEKGPITLTTVDLAETKMMDAERYTASCESSFGEAWQKIWQEARRIGELGPVATDPKALWAAEVKTFGALLQQLYDSAAKKNSADQSITP